MDFEELKEAFARQELFEGKTWRTSPKPWELSGEIVESLEAIGQASLDFYKALEVLYSRSADGKKLLRNKELFAPWVAEYLDRGKPKELVALSRSKACKGRIPPVIRPDLLVTQDGFSITELDSVPGGIGLTAYLNALYQKDSEYPMLGADGAMANAFYRRLAGLAPEKDHPVIAIVISEEAVTYKPEMDWLAEQLQLKGFRVFSLHADDVFPLGGALYFDVEGNPEKIDVVYRFFELFDLANIKTAEFIIEAWESGEIALDPPLRPFFEEKAAMGLYHHHLLAEFWKEAIPKRSHKILDSLIPKTWIVDPAPLPPGAVVDGPYAQGCPLHSWMDLAEASQKERNLVLKISGFHETAWGSRSVVIGSDVSKEEWTLALKEGCSMADTHLHVIQEFRKSVRLKHPLYSKDGEIYEASGRLRLNPYYFVNGDKAELAGALATFCPPDKKIIHGMEDAAMLPCCVKG
ncbi:MAG: hypothetical protein HOL92_17030 [Opitutales bacterium]|jgi:hypothetical protein|nr:hypothetical protein [Opitutales bacterium]